MLSIFFLFFAFAVLFDVVLEVGERYDRFLYELLYKKASTRILTIPTPVVVASSERVHICGLLRTGRNSEYNCTLTHSTIPGTILLFKPDARWLLFLFITSTEAGQ